MVNTMHPSLQNKPCDSNAPIQSYVLRNLRINMLKVSTQRLSEFIGFSKSNNSVDHKISTTTVIQICSCIPIALSS